MLGNERDGIVDPLVGYLRAGKKWQQKQDEKVLHNWFF
jgi:hypothetical protein